MPSLRSSKDFKFALAPYSSFKPIPSVDKCSAAFVPLFRFLFFFALFLFLHNINTHASNGEENKYEFLYGIVVESDENTCDAQFSLASGKSVGMNCSR